MTRLVLLLFLGTASCAGTLTRIPAAQPDDAVPKIDRLTDLGALPIPDGPVALTEQDERFTPSEWVAVVGEGLHKAELSLDDQPIAIGGYLSGGSVLVRLPSNLAPQKHHLVAKSSAGQAEMSFDSMTYVVG